MQTRLAISAVVLLLSAGVSVQTATACSKEAAAGAVDKWTAVLAENNPDTIVALYSKDAVLWGTLSSTVRSDPAGLKTYFVGAYQTLPKLTVKFGARSPPMPGCCPHPMASSDHHRIIRPPQEK